ncbi:MAG: hypothetical protein D6719_05745 [Candidatus Dadabacteria bacterium]|nr:MAG: hypothetical protein D6719_05745 [Candidatus Dadabacteria bacterium]
MAAELRPLVIRASAGSGKTYQLSSRYLKLLLSGASPEEILATTFTRKAAGEIRDRIIARLIEASESSESAGILGEALEMTQLSLENIHKALERMINNQHRLFICTLDSFFVGAATAFGPQAGLPAGWSVVDPDRIGELLDEAVSDVCRKTDELLALFDLVKDNRAPRSVHADLVKQVGALRDLVAETPAEVWTSGLSFDKPAENELAAAVEKLKNVSAPRTSKGTPNKNFDKALKNIIQAVSSGPGWEEELISLETKLLTALIEGKESYSRAPIPDELQEAMDIILKHIRCYIVKKLNTRTAALRELIESVADIYSDYCTLYRLASFDDVKRALFTSGRAEDLKHLFFRIDATIRHILLDEFQDTSLTEWRLLEPLADTIIKSKDGSFFCVGDAKQAIYGFRGGVAEIFDRLEERWPEIDVTSMPVSRRSSQTVLDFVNSVFKNLGENQALKKYPLAAEKWEKRFEEHRAFNSDYPGYVSVVNIAPDPEELVENGPIGFTAREVSKLLEKNKKLSVGVLVRKGKHVPLCINELARYGIRASGEGGSPLTDSAVVSVLLSYLWLADHPGDTIAHFHVASSPLAEVLGVKPDDDKIRRDLLSRSVREEFFKRGLHGLLSYYAGKVSPYCAEREYGKLQQLVEAAVQFAGPDTVRLSDFVKHARKIRVVEPEESPVHVMTIHKAKGLEFDAVFLCDLDYAFIENHTSYVIPDYESPFDPPARVTATLSSRERSMLPEFESVYNKYRSQEVVDELSVLYVALTRARYALYIFSSTKSRRRSTPAWLIREAVGVDGSVSEELYADSERAKLIYRSGDPDWAEQVKKTAEDKRKVNRVVLNVRFGGKRRRWRNLARVAPSEAGRGMEFIFSTREGRTARARGTLLHRLFQEIEWLDNFDVSPERLKGIVDAASVEARVIDEQVKADVLKDFLEMIKLSELRDALVRDAYSGWQADTLEVYRERSFSVVTGDHLSSGIIDRLVLGIKDGKVVCADIIDYKTDRNPELTAEKHATQLNFYREAVGNMYALPVEAITPRLIYIVAGRVVEL